MLDESFERRSDIQWATDRLAQQGMFVDLGGYDAGIVENVAAAKGRVGPEVRMCEVSSAEEVRLVTLRRSEGEIVGFAAIKRCAIGAGDLEEYLFATYRWQYAHGRAPFEIGRMPSLVSEVRGAVAYIGDLWVRPQDRVDVTSLAILVQSVAHHQLGAEWSYFFTRNRNAARGLAARYLTCRAVPYAIRWLESVEHRRDDDWLFVTRRDEFERAATIHRALASSEA